MKGFDEYYDEAVEPGKRERAYGWATAIGLQDVDGLKPSQYLIDTARRNIEGEISADEARRLVDIQFLVLVVGPDESVSEVERLVGKEVVRHVKALHVTSSSFLRLAAMALSSAAPSLAISSRADEKSAMRFLNSAAEMSTCSILTSKYCPAESP